MPLLERLARLMIPYSSVLDQAEAQPTQHLAYPVQIALGSTTVTLRLLDPEDAAAILEFARALPEHDLLFLRRDIKQADQVALWLRDAAAGLATTVLALCGTDIVGYATVASDGLTWTRHVRELRVLVAPSMRGKHLGRVLTEQAFAIAKEQGAKKMVAQMTPDQPAALAAFRRMGFESEARLRRQVMDRDGALHDLLILSLDIEAFAAKLNFANEQPGLWVS